MNILKWLKRKPKYVYGVCGNTPARKTRKGNVQMLLHKAGHQGRKEDYWHDFDSSWWPQFKPNV